MRDVLGEGLLGDLTFSRRGEDGSLEPVSDVVDVESMTQARAEDVTHTDGTDPADTAPDSAEASAS